jgi:hypothetical protein
MGCTVEKYAYVSLRDYGWYQFSGYGNAQNNRYMSVEKSNVVPLRDVHVGVWCALRATRIIRRHFGDSKYKQIF